MFPLSKSALLAGLLASQYTLALPEVFKRATTCAPTIYTTAHITTITVESIVTVPHSCFSFTAVVPQMTRCPTLTRCGPVPECILEKQTTIYVPPADTCCPTTGTTTTQGPCQTCQTGCAIFWETVTVTTTIPDAEAYKRDTPAPTTAAASPSAELGPCTYTLERAEHFALGPVKVLHPSTVTETAYVDCNGCEYVDVRNIGGLGPVAIFTTTSFDPAPATTTAFKCALIETAV